MCSAPPNGCKETHNVPLHALLRAQSTPSAALSPALEDSRAADHGSGTDGHAAAGTSGQARSSRGRGRGGVDAVDGSMECDMDLDCSDDDGGGVSGGGDAAAAVGNTQLRKGRGSANEGVRASEGGGGSCNQPVLTPMRVLLPPDSTRFPVGM